MRDFNEHLALAFGQFVQLRIGVLRFIATGRPRSYGGGELAFDHVLDQPLGCGRGDDRVALVHGTNGGQQGLRLGVLEQESRRTRIDRGHHILVQIESRQNDDTGDMSGVIDVLGMAARRVIGVRRRRFYRGDAACRLDSVRAGHTHVHEHDIRMQLLRERDCLIAVACLPDDLHLRLGSDDHDESCADEFLIVGDDHTDVLLLMHGFHCNRR